jgi:hypothetical protein
MADAPNFAKMVPGFDFLQGLVSNASAAMPSIGQWVAPTLNPEELDKRISELRAVQFWLEQNARMLAATIQALEVQRMTLSTLKTMNVQMEDLRESLKIRLPENDDADDEPEPPPRTMPPQPEPAAAKGRRPAAKRSAKSGGHSGGGNAVDPMQWWGALTQQFTQLATSAMQETANDAAKTLAAAAAPKSPSPAAAPEGASAKAPAAARKKGSRGRSNGTG